MDDPPSWIDLEIQTLVSPTAYGMELPVYGMVQSYNSLRRLKLLPQKTQEFVQSILSERASEIEDTPSTIRSKGSSAQELILSLKLAEQSFLSQDRELLSLLKQLLMLRKSI